jgi:phosphatidylinositol glycan class T
MDGRRSRSPHKVPSSSFPSYESNLTRLSIDARWKALQNSLSGLFCASLGNMDALHTTSPTRAFLPTGDLPRLPTPHAYTLRHATLPAERVCTENLTPFLKLLPCPSRAGIAALLEPHRIFDADWHGLGVHVKWRADAGVELMLTVQAVLDPVRTSANRRRGEIFFFGCLAEEAAN